MSDNNNEISNSSSLKKDEFLDLSTRLPDMVEFIEEDEIDHPVTLEDNLSSLDGATDNVHNGRDISIILKEANYYKMLSLFKKEEPLFPDEYFLSFDDVETIFNSFLKNDRSKDIIDFLISKKELIFQNSKDAIENNKRKFFNVIYPMFIWNNFTSEYKFKIQQEPYFIHFYNLITQSENSPDSFESVYHFYNDIYSYILSFDSEKFLDEFCYFTGTYSEFVEMHKKKSQIKYEHIIPIEESSIHVFLLGEKSLSPKQKEDNDFLIKLYLKNGMKVKKLFEEYIVNKPSQLEKKENSTVDDKEAILFDIENMKKTLKTLPSDMVDSNLIDLIKGSHVKKLQNNKLLLERIDTLKENFPNFSEFIDFIKQESFLNELGLKTLTLPPALLVGEPGIGKTFLLNSLNDIIENENYFLDMGSVTAGMVLSGSSEKWGNGSPGYILNTLVNSKYANPLIILDEIDKITDGSNHPVIPALLTLLEKHTARNFKDEFCSIKIDASHINWIGTANDKNIISAPLKSRFSLFEIPNPNKEERIIFAKQVFNKICKTKCLTEIISPLSTEFLNEVCKNEGSTRDISRVLTLSISAAAKRRKNNEKIILLPEDIQINNMNDKRKYGFI